MPNGDINIEYLDPSGSYTSPTLTPYEEPSYTTTDPDVAQGSIDPPFLSTSDHLRDREAGIPDTPWGNDPSLTWDWTQAGEAFQRAGQVLKPVISLGRDVAAIVTGRVPPSVQAARQSTATATAQSQQKRTLLIVGALGVGALLLFRR